MVINIMRLQPVGFQCCILETGVLRQAEKKYFSFSGCFPLFVLSEAPHTLRFCAHAFSLEMEQVSRK